jgi:hypothetical protein
MLLVVSRFIYTIYKATVYGYTFQSITFTSFFCFCFASLHFNIFIQIYIFPLYKYYLQTDLIVYTFPCMFCHLSQLVSVKCRKQYARLKRICRWKKGKGVHTQSLLVRVKRCDTDLPTLTNCQCCLEAISGVFPSLLKELILQISSWLDPASALAFSRTSRKFREN